MYRWERMPADRVPLNFLCRIRPGTCGPTRVAPRVSFRAQSGPQAVVRHDHQLSATPSWWGFRPVWNSPGSARPVNNPLGRLLGRARRTVATQAFGAHAIAQNARHRTDTSRLPGHRHRKQWASTASADPTDRFLCSGGPKAGSSNLGSPTNSVQVRRCFLKAPYGLSSR